MCWPCRERGTFDHVGSGGSWKPRAQRRYGFRRNGCNAFSTAAASVAAGSSTEPATAAGSSERGPICRWWRDRKYRNLPAEYSGFPGESKPDRKSSVVIMHFVFRFSFLPSLQSWEHSNNFSLCHVLLVFAVLSLHKTCIFSCLY